MTQDILVKDYKRDESCAGTACLECRDCKVINMEERRTELKNTPPQLYAKEAEHYFFYYAINMKQA